MTSSRPLKFYQLPPADRLALLAKRHDLTSKNLDTLAQDRSLSKDQAQQTVENVVSCYSLPYGVAPGLLVDGRLYDVPMVTEEPSVIAAASNGAKRLAQAGGTQTRIKRTAIGHVTFFPVQDLDRLIAFITHSKEDILEQARLAIPNMVKRGGGPIDCFHQVFEEEIGSYLSLYLTFDMQAAMGANGMNTALEAVGAWLEKQTGERVLLAILSNLLPDITAEAVVQIDPTALQTAQLSGNDVAHRLVAASHYAQIDPYRAATHNKGIMNGVDALVMATGNDWRAVNAANYTFHQGRPFSSWQFTSTGLVEGKIRLCLPLGVIGGTLSNHPTAQASLNLLDYPSVETLASIVASLGLAQNFAALFALVTQGIQKGHMALQYKSLAQAVGAQANEINALVEQLIKAKRVDSHIAQQLLLKMREEATHLSSPE